jgi:hypothetical protein
MKLIYEKIYLSISPSFEILDVLHDFEWLKMFIRRKKAA